MNLTNLTGSFLFQAIVLLHVSSVGAQPHRPVQWTFTSIKLNEDTAALVLTAKLDEGWHLYSQYLEEGGPLPTTFTFEPGNGYILAGHVTEESMPVRLYDETFMMDITWFTGTAVFTQKVTLEVPVVTIKGTISFMLCTDEMCLPPDEVSFSIELRNGEPSRKHDAGPEKVKKDYKVRFRRSKQYATPGSSSRAERASEVNPDYIQML
jgi:thiol:disulfide interchange protein DsbD